MAFPSSVLGIEHRSSTRATSALNLESSLQPQPPPFEQEGKEVQSAFPSKHTSASLSPAESKESRNRILSKVQVLNNYCAEGKFGLSEETKWTGPVVRGGHCCTMAPDQSRHGSPMLRSQGHGSKKADQGVHLAFMLPLT